MPRARYFLRDPRSGVAGQMFSMFRCLRRPWQIDEHSFVEVGGQRMHEELVANVSGFRTTPSHEPSLDQTPCGNHSVRSPGSAKVRC